MRSTVCRYFNRAGGCDRGDACFFRHLTPTPKAPPKASRPNRLPEVPDHGGWVEYVEISNIPYVRGKPDRRPRELWDKRDRHHSSDRDGGNARARDAERAAKAGTNTATTTVGTDIPWDETRPINTFDDVRVTCSSAEDRWFVCDHTIWVSMDRLVDRATVGVLMPPLGSKVALRAFYTGDADIAGRLSERRGCRWVAVEVSSTSGSR